MVKRKIIIASHNKLAFGMKETLGYITGDVSHVVEISAYLDNTPVDEAIKASLADVSADDEVIILTDLLGGSVGQELRLQRRAVPGLFAPGLVVILSGGAHGLRGHPGG